VKKGKWGESFSMTLEEQSFRTEQVFVNITEEKIGQKKKERSKLIELV